ncbi:MAG: peroxide stress protein YaaA [Peptostreptococcus sp.]|uniref:peroxide stress protein YaaA n=1 Tax=Peptostreptococcus sp. TaxID=1262 RepID=UPI002FC85F4A
MIIFISPAKGFNKTEIDPESIPEFIDKSKLLIDYLKTLDTSEISAIMKINEKLSKVNKERFESFKLDRSGSPALLAYSGVQYKNISLEDFDEDDLNFANKHLRILSGLYGLLRPMDSIYPYRLDISTKLTSEIFSNLYRYWDNKIFNSIKKDSKDVIINLASEEYSKAVKKYITDEKYISCTFKVLKNNKLKLESNSSKKARGLMVRYIIKNKITYPKDIKNFTEDGFAFSKELSSDNEFVFIKR